MHRIYSRRTPVAFDKYSVVSLRLYFLFRQAYTALLIRPLSVISTSLHNLFIDYIKEGFRFFLLTPGMHLNAYPYSPSRFRPAFLTYFRILQSKEPCGYSFSCETRCNVFDYVYNIRRRSSSSRSRACSCSSSRLLRRSCRS